MTCPDDALYGGQINEERNPTDIQAIYYYIPAVDDTIWVTKAETPSLVCIQNVFRFKLAIYFWKFFERDRFHSRTKPAKCLKCTKYWEKVLE